MRYRSLLFALLLGCTGMVSSTGDGPSGGGGSGSPATSSGGGGSGTGRSGTGGSAAGGSGVGGSGTGRGGAAGSAVGGSSAGGSAAGGSSAGGSSSGGNSSGGSGGTITAGALLLRADPTNRYLLDGNGAPFLVAGDSPQCLTAKLSPTDMAGYLAMRAQQGFNTAWVNALCNDYTGGNTNGTTYDGVAPFTGTLSGGTYDLSKPNEAFFQRVDAAVSAAQKAGIVLFLDPIETGGFLPTLRANGTTAAHNYGRFIGQRYLSWDNIVWMHGNDFQSWDSSASDDALVREVALGIKEVDTRHLQTVELAYSISSSLDDAANWYSSSYMILGLNLAYTYHPTYAELYKDYSRTTFLPTVMIEANYEGENNSGGSHSTNPHDVRTQYWWSVTSGASGSFFGNHWEVFGLDSTWASHPADSSSQMHFVSSLLGSRPWYQLVPDQAHAVVTSGLGTCVTWDNFSVNAQDNDCATTARTPDGHFVLAYLPTARAVVVNMTKLSGSTTARWYDPTTGGFTSIAGSPFANTGSTTFTPPSGNHSDGYNDWVLVLEAQ